MKNFSSFLLGFFVLFMPSLTGYAQYPLGGYNERIDQLELEIRRLTGKIETLEYKNKNLEIQLNGLRKEVEIRFEALKKQNTLDMSDADENVSDDPATNIINNAQKTDNTVTNSIQTDQVPSTENMKSALELYGLGQKFLKDQEFQNAAIYFQQIIDQHPEHHLAPNAYYWLGETFYARKDYTQAARTFLNGKKKFPESSKAGHNLLKLGLSLFYLNQTEEACLTFDEVEKIYTEGDNSLRETLDQSKKKASCS